MNANISVIGAPSSAGAHMRGQELGPQALRAAGLLNRLHEGFDRVTDLGDLPLVRHRPDRARRHAQNASQVLEVARTLADRIATSVDEEERLLVLGGDCTILLGVVSGLLLRQGDLGVLYMDAQCDLNTPLKTVSGVLDSMGMAHLLGEEGAVPDIARMGPRYPLLQQEQVLFYGYEPKEMNASERDTFQRRALRGYPAAKVAADPRGAARAALAEMESRCSRFLVHFDVDVLNFIDCPLANIPTIGCGLELTQALDSLEVFAASPAFAGLVITELNPAHADEAGDTLKAFVDGVSAALSSRREVPLAVGGAGGA